MYTPILDYRPGLEPIMYDENRPQVDCAMSDAKSARIMRPTIEQEIDDEVRMLTERLAKKQKLAQLLKENPVIAEFMNLSRS